VIFARVAMKEKNVFQSSLSFALAAVIGAIGGVGLSHLVYSLWRDNVARALRLTKDASNNLDKLADSVVNSTLKQPRHQVTQEAPQIEKPIGHRPIRIYVDGCFDLFHVGHSNALRQAKACGDYLVVGLVPDNEILLNKGSMPVMNEEERFAALSACKWVDEVIRNVPYDLSVEWVDGLMRDHKIDYIAHGDDPCITKDGADAYAYAKSIGIYKEFKRTEGASTTDIVGRILLTTKEHSVQDSLASLTCNEDFSSSTSLLSESSYYQETLKDSETTITRDCTQQLLSRLTQSHQFFLPTARRISQFSVGKVPRPQDKVVYVCGAWDLFNSGHISALIEAKKMGDFLLVGIHDDATVNMIRGNGLPILNLYERTLSLLSCKYVDEVIIGAPFVITKDLIKTMNISVVVKGTVSDISYAIGHTSTSISCNQEHVRSIIACEYAVPRSLGILREFNSTSTMTAFSVVERIVAHRNAFETRYDNKSKAEESYQQSKVFVEEK
jgi:ethanolamine-phosphate cytidylyltransferase